MELEKPMDLDMKLLQQVAERALSRSAGAPLTVGNQIDVLIDSQENFAAWEDAIQQAQSFILIEMYIFADNAFGIRMRDLLVKRAAMGLPVYLVYDWLGSVTQHLKGFFNPLIAVGAHVRAYNPPSLNGGISLLGRNHRKSIIVDGQVAFVSGLCISSVWEGNASKGIAPWRDTGLKIKGPLVADAIAAFNSTWEHCRGKLPAELQQVDMSSCGDVAARLIATTPETANMMRLDLMIASFAKERLWLTDAYFMGTGIYMTALERAARDGVDVRLLVPRSSDIKWIATVSRTLYRPLLEAGVRVFEWNGSMIHAKTAMADRRWARIGSTNLNISSWLANRELDVAIEDENVASKLAEQYENDLDNAVEIVLSGPRHRPSLSRQRDKQEFNLSHTTAKGTTMAAARQAARIGDALNVVVRGTRDVDSSEASAFLSIGVFLLIVALLFCFHPFLVVVPLVLLMVISGGAVLAKAFALYKARKAEKYDQDAEKSDEL